MYIVGVEACCIGNSCLKQTSFKALVDSGTSFTFLPEAVYDKIAMEVHFFCKIPISIFIICIADIPLPFFDSLTDE